MWYDDMMNVEDFIERYLASTQFNESSKDLLSMKNSVIFTAYENQPS